MTLLLPTNDHSEISKIVEMTVIIEYYINHTAE